jgi:hypothetical protein
MTAPCNGNAHQTPGPPGFRVFGAGNSTRLGRINPIFNALKTAARFVWQPIFNALKIGRAGDLGSPIRGGTAMQPPQ